MQLGHFGGEHLPGLGVLRDRGGLHVLVLALLRGCGVRLVDLLPLRGGIGRGLSEHHGIGRLDRPRERGAVQGASLRDGLLVKFELLEVLVGGGGVRLAVLALVLALPGDALELIDLRRGNARLADKLVNVARVPAQVAPGKDPLDPLPVLDTKVQGLVEQERLFVALPREDVRVRLSAFALLVGKQLGLALFVDSLHNELVLEVLGGAPDSGGCVLEDELGVSLGRKWPDEVELALGQVDHGLLVAGAKEELAD